MSDSEDYRFNLARDAAGDADACCTTHTATCVDEDVCCDRCPTLSEQVQR